MKDFKGTKGRWVFKEQGEADEYCVVSEDGRWVHAFRQNGEMALEEQRANARLMSTAPELLEVLQEVLDLLEKTELSNKITFKDVYEKSNKVINKVLR